MSEHPVPSHGPLGQAVGYGGGYDPARLFAIAREEGRRKLGLGAALPFTGCDVWNAYELSWLNPAGKPVVAWAELRVPADSPNIVESKSLKLYLNGFNQTRFAAAAAVAETLRRDLGACVGAEVGVEVRLPAQWPAFALCEPGGDCLDDLDIPLDAYQPRPDLLRTDATSDVARRVFSRLLRSRCPVTGQPDWGTVLIDYEGPAIDPAGLLAYIVSFREHQDFHEQCVERMFCDILQRCAPRRLAVSARYLRRGGIDINPWRSSHPGTPGNPRLFRQ